MHDLENLYPHSLVMNLSMALKFRLQNNESYNHKKRKVCIKHFFLFPEHEVKNIKVTIQPPK